MNRLIIVPSLLLVSALVLGSCQKPAPKSDVAIAELRRAMLQKTEALLNIHLRLDAAASDISDAQMKARSGDCSTSDYFASEAYRKLERADDDILDLGRELQELFNLDAEVANGP